MACHPSSLHAQEAAAKPEEGLQTVVVSAQKRLQSMQNVPVAVNTVDSRAIENQQIMEFSDLTRVAPSMTLNQNPGNNTISLRVIGTFAYSTGIESAVSVIVDDVPVIQQAQAFSNLSDIERIEVLRGPQGTLFGKNSSGRRDQRGDQGVGRDARRQRPGDKSCSSFIGDHYNFYNGSHVLMQYLPRNSERYAGVRVKYEF